MERLTLEVLKNRLDKCPSDMTSTGGLALMWREGEDGTDTCPAAWANRQHMDHIYSIPPCKNILNYFLKLLKIVALLGKKNLKHHMYFYSKCSSNSIIALILVFTGLGFRIISHALLKSLGFSQSYKKVVLKDSSL